MKKNMMIRNSTAEFLTFIAEGKEDGIQVLYRNESIWAKRCRTAVFCHIITIFTVSMQSVPHYGHNRKYIRTPVIGASSA